MVKAPLQAPVADAAASTPAMQHSAGRRLANQKHHARGVDKPQATTAAHETTRRDVHTASSVNAQRRLAKSAANEQAPDRPPAVRHLKSDEGPKNPPPKSPTTNSKPVLVRGPSTTPNMMKKKKHPPADKSTSPKIPPVESFSFQDILGSIGPEANASIDAIAEICGRSKMSLAAEHGSHRPPQGQLATTGSNPDNRFLPARLEPVAETSSNRPHTRSMSKNLALATGSPGNPTAAASNVTSHTHTSAPGDGKGGGPSTSASASASLLPHVLAWLRRSGSTTVNEQISAPSQDAGAVNAMHKLLNDTSEAQS